MQEWTSDELPEGFISFKEAEPVQKRFGWFGWLLVKLKEKKFIVSVRAMIHPDIQEPFEQYWIQENLTQAETNELEPLAWKGDDRMNNKFLK